MLSKLIINIISFLLTWGIVLIYKNWALKRLIIDIPNERSSHVIPTPRGGGVAIVITFYILLFYLYLIGQLEKDLFLALLPGVGIATIGFIDDCTTLSPLIRLGGQFLFSGIALFFLGGFDGFFLYNLKWVWTFIALIGFVWFINLFNFLDGSDGYASMEAISIAMVLWYFTRMDVIVMLVLSIGGFLYWNWPRARVFLGDVGSTFLGFILIVFGVYLHNNLKLSLFFWLIITSLFWFDATVTLLRRILNKEKLSQAHKKHIYQRTIQGGFSHLKTLSIGFGINILLFFICLIVRIYCIPFFYGLFATIIILVCVMKYVDKNFAFKKD